MNNYEKLTDAELDGLVHKLDQIILKGKESVIQELTMIRATDTGIIYDLRLMNKQLMRLAIGGWLLTTVLLMVFI